MALATKTLINATPKVDTSQPLPFPVVEWIIEAEYSFNNVTLNFTHMDKTLVGVDPYTVSRAALLATMPLAYDEAFDFFYNRFSLDITPPNPALLLLSEDNPQDTAYTAAAGAAVTFTDTVPTNGLPVDDGGGNVVGFVSGDVNVTDTYTPVNNTPANTANPEYFDWTLMAP